MAAFSRCGARVLADFAGAVLGAIAAREAFLALASRAGRLTGF